HPRLHRDPAHHRRCERAAADPRLDTPPRALGAAARRRAVRRRQVLVDPSAVLAAVQPRLPLAVAGAAGDAAPMLDRAVVVLAHLLVLAAPLAGGTPEGAGRGDGAVGAGAAALPLERGAAEPLLECLRDRRLDRLALGKAALAHQGLRPLALESCEEIPAKPAEHPHRQ